MTTYPDPINQPYVLCFVRSDGRLRALTVDPLDPGIDAEFAIYPTRSEANRRIPQYQAGGDTVVFSVPATALFDTKVVETFALKPRQSF